jgi:hypothetical protein
LSFQFRPLEIRPIEQKLSSSAGLGILLEKFNHSVLRAEFEACLPKRIGPNSEGSYRLGLLLIASLVAGHECLEDIEQFRLDPIISHLFDGESNAARTVGDFLRDFDKEHTDKLRAFLVRLSIFVRKQIQSKKVPHFSIDTTSHIQSGRTLEGLAYNYKGEWCLDSQVVFDELGLCYGAELRPGNTKSGSDAVGLTRRALSPYLFRDEKRTHADSAFCHQEYIECQLSLGAKFTITANEATTGWNSHINEITDWESWKFEKKYAEEAVKRGQVLPRIEVGRFLWQPSWNEVLRFPIVVKRTWLEEEGKWDHYAVVTNYSLYKHTKQTVIEEHNSRGNAENFIREQKYGYDLKHFPCKPLVANEAYLLLAMVAHNLMRWAALVIDPEKPPFAKRFRNQFIHRPGRLVNHSGRVVLKVSRAFFEEVTRLRQAWRLEPRPALGIGAVYSTA